MFKFGIKLAILALIGYVLWLIFMKPGYDAAQNCFDTATAALIDLGHNADLIPNSAGANAFLCDGDESNFSDLRTCLATTQAQNPIGYYVYTLQLGNGKVVNASVSAHNTNCTDRPSEEQIQ
jgi:hypothetical protein